VWPAIGVRAEEDDLFGLELLGHVAGEAADDTHWYVRTAIPASWKRLALRVGWGAMPSGHDLQMALW
jgi:hypothetical protein